MPCGGRLLTLLLLCGALMACGKKEPSTNGAAAVSKTAAYDPHVVQTAQLHLLHSGEPIAHPQNPLKLQGHGLNSTYKAVYKFNSGVETVFSLLAVNQTSHCTGGSFPEMKARLQGPDETVDVPIGGLVALHPGKDYALTLASGAHECTQYESNLEVIAWADHPRAAIASPTLARVCHGKNPAQITVLMGTPSPRAYAGNGVFLNDQTLCGQPLGAGQTLLCRDGELEGLESYDCATQSNPQLKLALNFDMNQKALSVVCSKGDAPVFNATFTECEEQVLDSAAMTTGP